jgi:hypothetical protein
MCDMGKDTLRLHKDHETGRFLEFILVIAKTHSNHKVLSLQMREGGRGVEKEGEV